MKKNNQIDRYIAEFPAEVREKLEQLRATIAEAAPMAEEIISYQMPAYKMNGMLVYFAGYKNHTGFYPTASGIEVFKNEISAYTWARGSVQFPHNQPLPLDLITRIVKFRLEEDSLKAESRKAAKKPKS